MPICLALAAGCSPDHDGDGSKQRPDKVQSELDRLRGLPYAGGVPGTGRDDREGVVIHERERVQPGYNLYSIHQASRAELIDNDGQVIRSWSYVPSRVWSNCELLPNGDLLVIGIDPPRFDHPGYADSERYIMRFDFNGKVIWRRMMPAHHDVELTPRNELLTLTLGRRKIKRWHTELDTRDDYLTLLDSDGAVLRSVSVLDVLSSSTEPFAFQDVRGVMAGYPPWIDVLHINSVEWMRWKPLEGEHPIYESGNVLICSRHQDVIAVIDFDKARLVWTWGRGELSGAHDAQVLENGNILIFDNGIDPQRQWSRVIEVDPVAGKIVWEYKAPEPKDFFSLSKGSAQRLDNGNTLIASSDQGRAFEVTEDGEVVWEYLCPHRLETGERATIVRMKRYEPRFIEAIQQGLQARKHPMDP